MTLEVRQVAIQRGHRLVVEGLTFAAARGEVLALTGASGVGKTSVLRAIGGLEPIAAGEIQIGAVRLTPGRLLHGRRARDLHSAVGIVFQFHHLFSHLTALENILLAPVHVLRQPKAAAERQARRLLEMLGIEERADAMPHELSGGEAQRVAIARALAMRPAVLLMDEPTASLDAGRRRELAATLRRLADEERTIVVATHDREFVEATADRAVVLEARRA